MEYFSTETLFFIGFTVFITTVLLIDLLFVGRKSHIVSIKESSIWTAIWVSFALLFYVVILHYGDQLHSISNMDDLIRIRNTYAPYLALPDNFADALSVYKQNMATEYLTGYFMEYTLSIDNVFVIMMILAAFSVDPKNYKQILFWGVLGAIILRFIFIFAGAALIQRFAWILLVFGGFLVYSGVKMFLDRNKEEKIETRDHWLVKYLSRHFRVMPDYNGKHFFIRQNHLTYITPLFIVLIMVEFTDLVFAFDSIPAIFSITRDPYLVFFSNIFAIIGLRSLFFLLIRVIQYFRFLKIGVSFLLVYIGIKLLAHSYLDDIGFKSVYSLYIILATLAISILASVFIPDKNKIKE